MFGIKQNLRVKVNSLSILSLFLLAVFCSVAYPQQSDGNSQTGALRIKTDVTGVQILLDEQEVGVTPLTLSSVAVGKHRLTFIKDGYQREEREVEVTAAKTASLFVVLKPYETPLPTLPISYQAIHKHFFGGCAGVLTIKNDGIEYKAEDGKDVFNISLRQMKSISRSSGAGIVFGVPTGGGGAVMVGVGNQAAAEHIKSINNFSFRSEAGVESLKKLLPIRIDAEKGFGFWLFEESKDAIDLETALKISEKQTREGFDLLYRLWTADVSLRSKTKP
jgi:hypothetical protein